VSRFRHISPKLAETRIKCIHCGAVSPVPFYQRLKELLEVVFPKDHHPKTNNKIWVPHGIQISCEKCKNQVMLELPSTTKRTTAVLFGDEADRAYFDRRLFLYSLVGADEKLLPTIADSYIQFKQGVCPAVPHHFWRMHMMEAWDSRRRRKHMVFGREDFQGCLSLARHFIAFLESVSGDLFIFCTISKNAGTRNEGRRLAYSATLASLIEGFTELSVQPEFVFEHDNCSSSDLVASWASEHLKDLKSFLVYPFLANGIHIPEPRFVPKATHPLLEIADFVAFIVARSLHRTAEGREREIDPRLLGKVTWLVDSRDGGLLELRRQTFPIEQIMNC
jgi:hypothetical protein